MRMSALRLSWLLLATMCIGLASAHGHHDDHEHPVQPSTMAYLERFHPEYIPCVRSHTKHYGRRYQDHQKIISHAMKMCSYLRGEAMKMGFLSEEELAGVHNGSPKPCVSVNDPACSQSEWCYVANERDTSGLCLPKEMYSCMSTVDCASFSATGGLRWTCEKESEELLGRCQENSAEGELVDENLSIEPNGSVNPGNPPSYSSPTVMLDEMPSHVEPMTAEEAAKYPPSSTTRRPGEVSTCGTHHTHHSSSSEFDFVKADGKNAVRNGSFRAWVNSGKASEESELNELGSKAAATWAVCGNALYGDVVQCDNPMVRNNYKFEKVNANGQSNQADMVAKIGFHYVIPVMTSQTESYVRSWADYFLKITQGQIYTLNSDYAQMGMQFSAAIYYYQDNDLFKSRVAQYPDGDAACQRCSDVNRFNANECKFVDCCSRNLIQKKALNENWGHHENCISFDQYYERISGAASLDPTTMMSVMQGRFNTFPAHFANPGLLGFAFFPWDADGMQGVVAMNLKVTGPNQKTLSHELGHALGLLHTFAGVEEVRCTANSQCTEDVASNDNGDFCSDTVPVPRYYACDTQTQHQILQQSNCRGTKFQGLTDNDYRNYMSYVSDQCMSVFTPDQSGRARCYLSANRKLRNSVISQPSVGVTTGGSRCDRNKCKNGGQLNSSDCTCACTPAWKGEVCNIPKCGTTQCKNGGKLNYNNCSCQCVAPYYGQNCELRKQSLTASEHSNYMPRLSQSSQDSGKLITNWGYTSEAMGCFSGGELDDRKQFLPIIITPDEFKATNVHGTTPSYCHYRCHQMSKAYNYFAVDMGGVMCYCSTIMPKTLALVEDTECNMRCADGNRCGSNHLNSRYAVRSMYKVQRGSGSASSQRTSNSRTVAPATTHTTHASGQSVKSITNGHIDDHGDMAEVESKDSPTSNATPAPASTPAATPTTPAVSQQNQPAAAEQGQAPNEDPPVAAPTEDQQQGPDTFVAQAGEANKTLKMGSRVVAKSPVLMNEGGTPQSANAPASAPSSTTAQPGAQGDAVSTTTTVASTASAPASAAPSNTPNEDPPVAAPTEDQQQGPDTFVAQAGEANKTLKMGSRVVTKSPVLMNEVTLNEALPTSAQWPGVAGGAACSSTKDCSSDASGNDFHTGEPRSRCVNGKCECAYWVAGSKCEQACWRGLQDFGATRILSPDSYHLITKSGFARYGNETSVRMGIGCSGNGVCRDSYEPGSPIGQCDCHNGYHGDACQMPHSQGWQESFPAEGTVFLPTAIDSKRAGDQASGSGGPMSVKTRAQCQSDGTHCKLR